ncbi:MAG: ribosome small subunit-dependent GTPase A [Bacteroidales bacterium]|nr:ribosome small subunit-dependent GTPase A [Bacteroidales bacterium]
MILEQLGYDSRIEDFVIENNLKDFEIGRVISEHKERYIVKTQAGEYDAEITGNLRFTAESRSDFPAVGDWVALTVFGSDLAIIHKIIPRFSAISRQAVGQFGDIQIIAANIDYALLVQACDRDFNINRLERYLTICHSSKVLPVIVLTKTDLLPENSVKDIVKQINIRLKNIPVYAISNESLSGYDHLKKIFKIGKSFCLLGSSGVGKSTLLNKISGREVMKTGSISESTSKGRHVTSHRELIILENGGVLIDNPGMREVGVVDCGRGLETTFEFVGELSDRCRFKDCTHTSERGCAVKEAVENGDVERAAYENYLKMQKERDFFEASELEKRRKEKIFGKILKDYKDKDIKGRG